ENTYATGGLVDYSGPVLRLANLTPEDFYLLLTRLRLVFAGGDANAYLVPDDALTAFMTHCSSRIGDAYFRTPRTTIKEFVNLLAVLEQNPGT
ncbi:BREX system ATP-binding domain-containing protein, partial [Enterococcus faecium]